MKVLFAAALLLAAAAAAPGGGPEPIEVKPIEIEPEIVPAGGVKPIEVKPIEVKPIVVPSVQVEVVPMCSPDGACQDDAECKRCAPEQADKITCGPIPGMGGKFCSIPMPGA